MPKLSPVSYKHLVRVFEADGFRCVREEGNHMIFTKPGMIGPAVIPKYSSVPVFVIKNNLREHVEGTLPTTPREITRSAMR